MYAVLCGAASDALSKLEGSPQDIPSAKGLLRQGLLDTEELYLQGQEEAQGESS